MKILLLGSGGREHALAWKISKSPLCTKLFIAPGNAGTALEGENISLSVTDFEAIKQFVLQNEIEMVVVGPEDPLVAGIFDFFLQNEQLKNIPVIGPSQQGAMLEGSKSFAKQFMQKHKIPTANYIEVTAENLSDGFAFIDKQSLPIVLKADGLAAGKGVLIINDYATAKAELESMILAAKFGKASAKVVIESFLSGIEFSVFVLTDGKDYLLLPNAKDYKRIGEKDSGLNTGGMGCVSPVPFVDDAMMQQVTEKVILPTLDGLQKDGIIYHGFIYFGLINVGGEPYVIEYNCRMGDPETEVVMPRLTSDLLAHFVALSTGKLSDEIAIISTKNAATVILASGGYPEDYKKGLQITDIPDKSEAIIPFFAGVKNENNQYYTNGGRVMAITALGDELKEAVAAANAVCDKIQFENKYFRKDIGWEFYS